MKHSTAQPWSVRTGARTRLLLRRPARAATLVLILIGVLAFAGCSDAADRSAGPDASRPETTQQTGDGPVIAVVGDSYTTGSDMDSGPESNWSALMADELRLTRPGLVMHVEAGGGSGYTTTGFRNLTFEGLAKLSMPADPDLIIVFGSLNDNRSRPSAVDGAARSLMTWLHEERPDATILVIGPPWMNELVPANLMLGRDAVRSAALGVSATFVDPLAEGWFAGDAASLIGSDRVHPTDEGQRHLAELITPTVERLLASRPIP